MVTNSKMEFKIGAFSKLCQVTVKTLRHYEEIGLLVPARVDPWTGYRYYDLLQLRRMNRIVYLKQLGFSLDEVSELFEQGLELPTVEMIRRRRELCREQMDRLATRQAELARLEEQLRKQKKVMPQVFEKTLPARIFATHRCKIDSYQDLFSLCPDVIGPEMRRLGCVCPQPEYCFTVEYQEEYGVDIDIAYFEAVAERKEDSDLIQFVELSEVPLALCIHHVGPYETLPTTFAELYVYVEAHGYEPSDPARFCYIDGIWNKESPQEWLTEIQLPVRHAKENVE